MTVLREKTFCRLVHTRVLKGGGSIIWVVVNKHVSFNKFQSDVLETLPMSVCESAWLMWPF